MRSVAVLSLVNSSSRVMPAALNCVVGGGERLHPHGVPGGHAEELALHAVQRDLPGLHLGVGPREEHQIAELGVRHEVGVGGADERGVGERQLLARAVRDPQHRHRGWCAARAPLVRTAL